MKKLVIEKHNNGDDYCQISSSLNLSYRSVQSIVQRSKKQQPLLPRGRAAKLDSAAKALIKSIIDEDCTVTVDYIRQHLADRGCNSSRWTIGRTIRGFNYSLKRTSLIPERKNTPSTVLARKTYSEEFLSFDISKKYFLDEAGFQYSMRRSYGRSAVGTKAAKVVPAIRCKNISLCACISNSSVFFFEIMDRAYNAKHFSEFIDILLNHFESLDITYCVLVMDNVRFHHSQGIESKIVTARHRLVYLPPYSPFLNPIEEVFSKWKGLVKAANCRNEDDLYARIHTS